MVAPTRVSSAAPTLIDLHPATDDLTDEVLAGLRRPDQKTLPCKLFYDERGSRLFEQICELPEYYPTRTEAGILRDFSGEIARSVGPDALVLEPGSGAGMKTRILLDALDQPAGYVALDIDRSILARSAAALTLAYPSLPIVSICADYTRPFRLPAALPPHERRLLYFPGSTIGNLHPQRAVRFLERAREWVGRNGCMIIGVDTRKSREQLEAAYNDQAGVTAQFNLNALRHLNRAIGSNFNLNFWAHDSVFNSRRSRIEMHLISTRSQDVRIGEETIAFKAGESIRTECSYKYAPEEFQDIARQARLRPRRCWMDAQSLFSVHYLEMPDSEFKHRLDF